jgi:hypothetical protein
MTKRDLHRKRISRRNFEYELRRKRAEKQHRNVEIKRPPSFAELISAAGPLGLIGIQKGEQWQI